VRTATTRQRLETAIRRCLVVGAALLAPVVLLPDSIGYAILDALSSFSGARIAEIAAVTNALTLIP